MIKKLPFFVTYLSILMCQWGLEHFIHPNAFLLNPYKQGSFIGVENYSNIVFMDSDKTSKAIRAARPISENPVHLSD